MTTTKTTTRAAEAVADNALPIDKSHAWLEKATGITWNTQKGYLSSMNRINAFMAKRKSEVINESNLMAFIKYRMKSGVCSASIIKDVCAINYIARQSGVPSPVTDRVKKVVLDAHKVSRKEMRGHGKAATVSMEQVNAAIDKAVRDKPTGLRDAALIALAIDACLRVDDLIDLNIGDLIKNRKRRHAVIVANAAGEDHEIVIKPQTASRIHKYLAAMQLVDADDEPMFRCINRVGEAKPGRMNVMQVRDAVKCRLIIVGADKRVSPYSLFRRGCIEFIKAGGTTAALKARARFKLMTTARLYAHEAMQG